MPLTCRPFCEWALAYMGTQKHTPSIIQQRNSMAAAERDPDDRNVLDFSTYEDYLDQQVTGEDLFYLEDQDAARKIVELGYKGKDVLSRDEFEAAQHLARTGPLKRRESAEVITSAGKDVSDSPLLTALAKREELVRTGKLATVLFLRDYVSGQEVSAYIDYGYRLRSENFEAYFKKEKKLLPKRSDLSYYNWKTHTLFYNNSPTFQVLADSALGLVMKHKRDRKAIHVDPNSPSPGENCSRTVVPCKDYLQAVIYDHVTRRKN
ncbi:conserved hypothetical protein [Leishmania infantum JPCM5]|uniref:Cilia- and flagella-associated protein 299 n=4 Tax=Leishmania donovani species complex TaxID=38574 RepID=A0A6L0WJE8_LEIIN|nr:conserved hypothetical protein [Leishmania infantum JPCM5]XP_003858763.1 hypothetical protein, conserved [Leishmania donovani]CAC9454418.1 Domain_of_uncharacterised_function_(DUF4464)_-__putative [Leishmania infantum]CAM65905.1 conserved hypothetical protein [Leishmania infantum JPCM5]CBZ32043.1 hypothetical protein, conserved [Leishmania donovani]SUZ39532.1 Domain_of_uncharacterised_function_(DUF4464)_-__putative [Leishmania infantum]|eukprot:XP_001463540.1 conserved hypothetical protein [Leishmania infantum JPCM5]